MVGSLNRRHLSTAVPVEVHDAAGIDMTGSARGLDLPPELDKRVDLDVCDLPCGFKVVGILSIFASVRGKF